MAAQPTQPAGEGVADAEALERLALLPAPDRAACYAHFAAIIAERDALKLLGKRALYLHAGMWDLADGSGCFVDAVTMRRVDEVFSSIGVATGDILLDEDDEQAMLKPSELLADRDRLAARCERLEKLLRNCRDNYVEPMLRSERIAFKGNENCSDIANIESDLAAINAALSPPASDAADSTHGETK